MKDILLALFRVFKLFISSINQLFEVRGETSAPILITLFTFFLSYILIGLGQFFRKKSKNKIFRSTFIISLTRMHILLKKQSDEFKKSAEAISMDNSEFIYLRRIQILPEKIFDEIGYQNTLEAFNIKKVKNKPIFIQKFSNLKNRVFFKTWEVIIGANTIHNRFFNDYKDFLKDINNYNDRRNDAVEAFNNFFIDMIINVRHAQENDKMLDPKFIQFTRNCESTRVSWEQLPDKNHPEILNENLIQPFRNLLKETNLNCQEIGILSSLLLRCDHEFINHRNSVLIFKKVTTDNYWNFNRYSKSIKYFIKILEIKNYYQIFFESRKSN
jgi:hypothetical protein